MRPGSRLLWLHAASVLLKTVAVVALLDRFSRWVLMQQLRSRRAALALAAPATRTVLVTQLPACADAGAQFALWYGEEALEAVVPVVRSAALAPLAAERRAILREAQGARRAMARAAAEAERVAERAEKAAAAAAAAGSGVAAAAAQPPQPPAPPWRPTRRVPRWLPWAARVDTLSYCAEMLLELDTRLAAVRRAALAQPPARSTRRRLLRDAAFVTFADARTAGGAAQCAHACDACAWAVAPAPQPGSVVWDNVGRYGPDAAALLRLAAWALTCALCALYLLPAALIQQLAQPATLRRYAAALAPALGAGGAEAVAGVLPPALLYALTWVWPVFLRQLTLWQGAATKTEVDRGQVAKCFLFNVAVVFLSTVLLQPQAALLGPASAALARNPQRLPATLAVRVPATAPFFFSLAVVQGLAGAAAQLARWPQALQYWWRAPHPDEPDAKWPPAHQPFGRFYPHLLLQLQVLVLLSTAAPLMHLVSLAFFVPALTVAKAKMMFHHERQYEGDGRMWPLVRACVVAILLLYQTTMVALLALKGAPKAAWAVGLACMPGTLLAGFRMEGRYGPAMSGATPLQLHTEREAAIGRRATRISSSKLNGAAAGGCGGGGGGASSPSNAPPAAARAASTTASTTTAAAAARSGASAAHSPALGSSGEPGPRPHGRTRRRDAHTKGPSGGAPAPALAGCAPRKDTSVWPCCARAATCAASSGGASRAATAAAGQKGKPLCLTHRKRRRAAAAARATASGARRPPGGAKGAASSAAASIASLGAYAHAPTGPPAGVLSSLCAA